MKVFLLILSILVSFTSCDKSEDEGNRSATENKDDLKFKSQNGLTYNDTIYLGFKTCIQDDYLNKVCFDTVLTDSRCPEDVICIWQGEAIARFIIWSGKSMPVAVDLKAGTTDSLIRGLNISFVQLLPYPNTQNPHEADDYVAGIVIRQP